MAGDRPNILWITSEDNSASWLGCYGNEQAATPCINDFAEDAILYQYAYSNSPVCAVARSTLFTGMYATTIGTQHMRSRYAIPERIRPYVSYLRDAGYYCTNNSKTDYNFFGLDKSWWDESGKHAHYRNRPPGAPFFAIFNLSTTHESSLFAQKTTRYRDNKLIPEDTRIAVEDVHVPPLFPDLPEIRDDIATYLDIVSAMDKQVGEMVDELEEAGLAEETIVFYYSDHGGILPRSKRYVHDTGTHVPLIIRIPKKFRDCMTPVSGSQVNTPVSFVDFAPTVLSLAGIELPSHHQGRAFLGPQHKSASHEEYIFLYGDRFDETIRMHRAITDGHYRYVRNFYPHMRAALENDYPYGIASWRAWRDAANSGQLPHKYRQFWERPQPCAEFYDVKNDPWEVANLITVNKYKKQASSMRSALRQIMLDTRDLGVIPEAIWSEIVESGTIYEYAHDNEFPWQEVVGLAFKASDLDATNLPSFKLGLQHTHPVIRYWAAVGCLELGPATSPARSELRTLLDDCYAVNRITAAHALYQLDPSADLIRLLTKEAAQGQNDAAATLAFHTLYQLNATDAIPTSVLREIVQAETNGNAEVWANRQLKERH